MKGVRFAPSLIATALVAGLLAFSAGAWSEQGARPSESVKQSSAVTKPVRSHEIAVTSPINLNKADAQTLAQLHGIGEKKAQAIIAYREANGGFKTVDELANVKGIGQKFLDKNRSMLSVN